MVDFRLQAITADLGFWIVCALSVTSVRSVVSPSLGYTLRDLCALCGEIAFLVPWCLGGLEHASDQLVLQ
jgi:hypothetical protein